MYMLFSGILPTVFFKLILSENCFSYNSIGLTVAVIECICKKHNWHKYIDVVYLL